MDKIIESIKFDAIVNGKKYFNLDLGITPSHSYTDKDIENGRCFCTHIGRDNYDAIIHISKGNYHLSLKQIVKDDKGKWIISKHQNKPKIKNIKINFCKSLV